MLSVLKKRRKCCSGKDLQKRKVLNLLSRSSVNTLTLLITSAKITSKKLNRLQLLSEAYSLQVKLSYILFLKQQHLQEREIKFSFVFFRTNVFAALFGRRVSSPISGRRTTLSL